MMKIAFNTKSTVSASALGRTGSRVPAKKSHIARNESSRSWDIGTNREVCKPDLYQTEAVPKIPI
jgi:hypothetical protein